jgi:hypothetical protein
MAHFAKLDENNKVLEVHVVSNDALDLLNEEQSGLDFLIQWSDGYLLWKQTSFNNKIRKQFAGVGFTYDSVADVFIAPQPFPSWSLDENHDWQAPKPKPNEGFWVWDEETQEWVNVEPFA